MRDPLPAAGPPPGLVWNGVALVGLLIYLSATVLGLQLSTLTVIGYAAGVAWVTGLAKALLAMALWRLLAVGRAFRPILGALAAMLAVALVDFTATGLVLSSHPDTPAPPLGELMAVGLFVSGYFVYPLGDVTLPLSAIIGFLVARWCEHRRIARSAIA